MKMPLRLLIVLVLIVSTTWIAQAQDTLDLVEALAIVRDAYGDDAVTQGGVYDDENACWEFTLDDDSRVCVSDTTGEFVDLLATGTSLTGNQGFMILAGLIGGVALAYLWLRNSTRLRLKLGTADGDSATAFQVAYTINGVTARLLDIATYLALQSIIARWIQDWFGDAPRIVDRIVRFVNINLEKSLPTWYASMLLMLAAVLLGLIARGKTNNPYRLHWFGLSSIFVYLSIDEATAIHEEFTRPLRELLGTTGFLHFAWVIIGAIFVAVVALLYLRFVFQLPAPVRNLIILAGALFVSGALLIESFSATLYAETGTTLVFSAIGTVEEWFEMLGVIVFIRALLLYRQTDTDTVDVESTQDES